MEFINTKKFLKQPKEVQEVFMEWWQPQPFDLYLFDKRCLEIVNKSDELMILPYKGNNVWDEKARCIPLFTEGHLRKFIEDRTRKILFIDFEKIDGKLNYSIYLFQDNDRYENYDNLGDDLLQAYWKVACVIAKESVEGGL